MKQFITLICLIISCSAISQSNGLDARNFISPQAGFRYDSAAVEDIIIRVRNEGPNFYFAGDSLLFDLSINTNDTSIFEKIGIVVTSNFGVSSFRDFTLKSGFKFDPENNYTVCTTPTGSKFYPQNSVKDPTACVSFVVSLEESKLQLEGLNYQNHQLVVSSNINEVCQLNIIDLTGKLLTSEERFMSPEETIEFYAPAKGIYFLQILSKSGKSSTSKFIVNQ